MSAPTWSRGSNAWQWLFLLVLMFQAGNSVSAEISERQKEKNAKERKKGTQQWSNRDRDSRERDRDSTAIDMETEKSRLKDRIVIQSMGRGGGLGYSEGGWHVATHRAQIMIAGEETKVGVWVSSQVAWRSRDSVKDKACWLLLSLCLTSLKEICCFDWKCFQGKDRATWISWLKAKWEDYIYSFEHVSLIT